MRKRWLTLLLLLPLVAGPAQGAEPAGGVTPSTLTGTVTGPDGRPLAGFSLWAVALAEQKGRDLPPSAVSGPDGSFSISGLPPGRIDLHACRRGYLPGRQSVRSTDAPVRLEIEPGVMIRGRVLDAEGAPMAGARVSAAEGIRHVERMVGPPWSPCRPSKIAESGEDGRFEIGPLERGSYDLHVDSPDSDLILEKALPLSIGDVAEVEVELRLKRHGGRKGSLTDTAGAPVGWAYVEVTPEQGEPGSYQAREDGSFLFFAEPGPVTFRVEQEGYEPFERTIEISSGETPVDLVLVRDATWKMLRGRVTEPDGTPVADAAIALVHGDAKARSAADGRFEMRFLPQEAGELVVHKEAYSLTVLHVDPENLPDGEIVIHLETGALVTGRLLGLTPADRSPDMWLTLRGVGSLGPEASVQADDTFRFENIPAGTWTLTFQGESRSVTRELVVPPGQAEVTVEVSLSSSLSGRVLDPGGTPLPQVRVEARPEPVAWLRSTLSEQDGSFLLADLPPGPFELLFEADGYESQSRQIETASGAMPAAVVLAREDRKECGPRDPANVYDPWEGFFENWKPSAEPADSFFLDALIPARGRVTGPGGVPVAGVRLTQLKGGSTATSSADGSFEISVLAHGWDGITAANEDLAGWRRVEPGGAPVEGLEIQLHPTVTITGRVLGLAAGQPGPSDELILQESEGLFLSTAVSADGTFRFQQIPPGSWWLFVSVSGREASTFLTVPPGQTEARVDLRLPALHPVSGNVLDERGQPLAGAQVLTWLGGRISAEISSETGADGRFSLALPDGEHHLHLRKEGYQWAQREIEVQGAPVSGLSFRGARTALLRGRLLGLPPGDKAIVEIEAVADLQSGTPREIEVGSGGYSISGLSPGLWRLAVRTPSCKLWRTIEIPRGTIEMDLDLEVAPEGPDRRSES